MHPESAAAISLQVTSTKAQTEWLTGLRSDDLLKIAFIYPFVAIDPTE